MFIRSLFIMLFVLSITMFAQTAETAKAYKFDEFGEAKDSVLTKKTKDYAAKVTEIPKATGYIFTYGEEKKILKLEEKIRKVLRQDFDASRFIFVTTTNRKVQKIEFWVIPEGTEPPQPSDND